MKESLQDEVKRLKSEVERLGAFRTHTIIPNEILMAENARLKAEVERLTKAEVERLRKEGEAMYPNLGPGWSHNAKEGKQP